MSINQKAGRLRPAFYTCHTDLRHSFRLGLASAARAFSFYRQQGPLRAAAGKNRFFQAPYRVPGRHGLADLFRFRFPGNPGLPDLGRPHLSGDSR